MNIAELLSDKTIKPKEKTELLSNWILEHPKKIQEVIAFASVAKDQSKATCIEALEFATRTNPKIASLAILELATESLSSKSPRVKWESAKVTGNIANQYPKQLDEAIKGLLINSEFDGTVVRWSSAFALGEIIKLKTPRNKILLPAIEAIIKREEKNSIKKIYLAAIKAMTK